MLTKSPAARTALVYVTVGALILIWTTVWWIYMRNNPPESSGAYYLLGGVFASGLILLVIGLGVGRLGSAARNADNPAIVVAPGAPPGTAAVVGPPQSVEVPAAEVAPLQPGTPVATNHVPVRR